MTSTLPSRIGILGTGSCVPERRLTNADLERLVDTSDEWIFTRTGMRERRIAAPGQATSDLAIVAARRALEMAGVPAEDVELIIVATITPDHVFPSTACLVQHALGARNAGGFDVSAACSGYINALMTGHALIQSGRFANALVIGAEVISSITNYRDRASCILFGDGAGAVFLARDAPRGEILDHFVRIDGSGADIMIVPSGGSRRPVSHDVLEDRSNLMQLRGREVFRFAVEKFRELVVESVKRVGCTCADIGLIVPHQVNLRIIEAAIKKLDIDMDRVQVNLDRYGNTSAASIPIALDEAVRTGRVVEGKLVSMVAFGAGLTWGSSLLRW